MTNKNKAFRSPLFYVGDKYKLYPKISKYFPKTINRFIEPFTGGGSVFLNVNANEYLLNDIDSNVIEIHNFLERQAKNPDLFFKNVFEIIQEYKLSHSYIKDIVPQELRDKWKKTYYAKFNKEGFNKLKKDYNSGKANSTLHLYVLLIYGFNRMLRFNSKGEYNLPVGNVDFNKNTLTALNNYFDLIKKKNTTFHNLDFLDFFENINFKDDDFVYLDPPYLITFSEYNKLWNQETEERLLKFLEYLDEQNINFAISNVTHYKGKINEQFLKWSENHYSLDIKSNYISYHDNSNKEFKEVLITNYQPNKSVSQKTMSATEIYT
ncbi:Dam family site-specific DNA-(adenine-N6)-methyltransferase [Tamlana haliotis]|uniref:Site-specific DNA-methyltransferase (adenine-specific) n=1 Tax=Pseudotamlana haliotis TaxID=2614804 RepID=A0A6N6MCD3_9FLAO|nr:Dam family site-specific DNA-(adenine-N6)-methyltransferase [Tamlana haliotis]KAB1067342.1 Dam family site-specific DNA-(adenine-N6)-methyltransferase [Tamlana haliotis]